MAVACLVLTPTVCFFNVVGGRLQSEQGSVLGGQAGSGQHAGAVFGAATTLGRSCILSNVAGLTVSEIMKLQFPKPPSPKLGDLKRWGMGTFRWSLSSHTMVVHEVLQNSKDESTQL